MPRGFIDLIGTPTFAATGSSNLVISSESGDIIYKTDDTERLRLAAAGTSAFAGSLQAASYLLADGSDKNYKLTVAAAGTAYSLTNTSAALDFGTTDPSLTINKAGTYLIFGRVNLAYTGATFAAVRTVTLKLRRTNNTAADLTGSSTALLTQIITTLTFTMGTVNLPAVVYTTTNTDDVITIFGDVSVAPTAGSLDATEASIVALRIA